MKDLKISLVQTSLHWENRVLNLTLLDDKLSRMKEIPDLILLPEMFTTGFTMNAHKCGEDMNGQAMHWLTAKAEQLQCVVAGSILVEENGKFFNRFIWMQPDGKYATYDKRHLFRMGNEHKSMEMGRKRTIVKLKDWKCNLQVCYDLRFPAWSQNRYENGQYDYDLLLYVANWPAVRRQAYQILLPARAVENQAWVAWVNRVGEDGNGVDHAGDSAVYDPYGNLFASAGENVEEIITVTLPGDMLPAYRRKFEVGPDWDNFQVE